MLTKRESKPSVESSMLYILEGNGTPFLQENSVVRFSSCTMAGSTTRVEIEGPARLLRQNNVVRLIDGAQAVGALNEEFEVLLTGKGKVVVRISALIPTSEFPDVAEYVIAVS